MYLLAHFLKLKIMAVPCKWTFDYHNKQQLYERFKINNSVDYAFS